MIDCIDPEKVRVPNTFSRKALKTLGDSTRLLIRWSQVRSLHGPPFFKDLQSPQRPFPNILRGFPNTFPRFWRPIAPYPGRVTVNGSDMSLWNGLEWSSEPVPMPKESE